MPYNSQINKVRQQNQRNYIDRRDKKWYKIDSNIENIYGTRILGQFKKSNYWSRTDGRRQRRPFSLYGSKIWQTFVNDDGIHQRRRNLPWKHQRPHCLFI